MVTLLGFAKTAFTVVLVAPVLVVAGFMHEFHQKFTFAEGFAFLFAVIAGVLPVSWFVWLPLGNAFLVQNTNFYKPSVPSNYEPEFSPVDANEVIFAMAINSTSDRFAALVGTKGVGKSTEMELICSNIPRAIYVP